MRGTIGQGCTCFVREILEFSPVSSLYQHILLLDDFNFQFFNVYDLGDDKNARIAIVFSACRLPPKTDIDHQKLFR
jgi:hypothetical protein